MGYHVLPDSQVLVQGDLLLYHTHAVLGCGLVLLQIDSVYEDASGIEVGECGYASDCSRLSCTVRSEESEQLSTMYSEIKAVDSGLFPEFFHKI